MSYMTPATEKNSCTFTVGVACRLKENERTVACQKCGHNPKVGKERTKKVQAKLDAMRKAKGYN